jgi:hypothetical protein
MDYEFTIVLDIDVKHHCIASKDRTNVFDNLPQFKPTKETGKAILDWCGLSNSLRDQIDQCDDLDSLKSLYEANPTERNAYRQRFIAKQQLLLANKFSKNGTSHH